MVNKVSIIEQFRHMLMETTMKKFAGVLVKADETGKILLLLRNSKATHPETWGLVAGGIEKGETPLEGLKREVSEELSINPDIIKYNFIHKEYHDEDNIEFYYYEGFTPKEFMVKLDHENLDFKWVDKDSLPEPLYPEITKKIAKI